MNAAVRVALIAVSLVLAPASRAAQEPAPSGTSAVPAAAVARELLPPRSATHASTPVLGGPPGKKSPWVAGGLAYLFPGAGHFYAGEPRRAWLVLGLVGIGATVMMNDGAPRDLGPAGGVLAIGSYVASIIDAPLAARRHNRRLQRERPPGPTPADSAHRDPGRASQPPPGMGPRSGGG